MSKTITISPVSRINGLWKIQVVVEGGVVVDAGSSGSYFRGIETILEGRDPRDASYFTQRICGICSTVHALASSLALEDAFQIEVPRNARLMRNLIYGADLLQNHLRQFYVLTLPDWVDMPEIPPFIPRYRINNPLPKGVNDRMVQNYMDSLDIHRMAHEMVTIFGGKAPHAHGIVAGGVTVPPDGDNIRKFSAILDRVEQFINEKQLPDAYDLGEYYPDYYQLGKRELDMFTFGMFADPDRDGEMIDPPGLVLDGQIDTLDENLITEEVRYAWYRERKRQHPSQGTTDPTMEKDDAYSWVKAPRYQGRVLEAGPLARLWASGKYQKGNSTHDRKIARVLEAKLVAENMRDWLAQLELGKPIFTPFQLEREGQGRGMVEAMRGGLGHWIEVRNYKISRYQIITPSSWNCSPRDEEGKRGPIEQCLIGTPIGDLENPIEIGRIVRSFDPCLSCAVQVISPQGPLTPYIIGGG